MNATTYGREIESKGWMNRTDSAFKSQGSFAMYTA